MSGAFGLFSDVVAVVCGLYFACSSTSFSSVVCLLIVQVKEIFSERRVRVYIEIYSSFSFFFFLCKFSKVLGFLVSCVTMLYFNGSELCRGVKVDFERVCFF